jgi:nucleoside-diphosphate-sugar epimerase
MRALLTGASSFTGCWFAEALCRAGFEVIATTRRPLATYDGLERRRLAKTAAGCELVEGLSFGDDGFQQLIRSRGPFDLLCHHGAEVGDLRRQDYDVDAALAANTRNADSVLRLLAEGGGRGLVVTGSVFEAGEGGGDTAPINAYGLAKTLTWHCLRFHAERQGLAVGRFVIPHPFGPLEKPGFTSALATAWLAGAPGIVRRPDLVRDLVPVELLALAYAQLCGRIVADRRPVRWAPSGIVGSLGDIAARLGREMAPRLDRPCAAEAAPPPYPRDEPVVRVNREPLDLAFPGWPWERWWGSYATYCISEYRYSISG